MTHVSNIREQLERIATWDDFFAVGQSLAKWQAGELYAALFPLAISGRNGTSPRHAGFLLIDLQPDCPEPLTHVIASIHTSNWFVSFREIPFYLVTQFGKRAVLDAAAQFLQALDSPSAEQSRVQALVYWTRKPASDLCKHFHSWEIGEFHAREADDA
jgi:hypothetical protein